MSFGEHLEELRSALWKSVLALAIGFAIGLCFGRQMVLFVQQPLNEGLAELRMQQAQRQYEATAPSGEDPDLPPVESPLKEGMAPQRYWIEAAELAALLRSLGVEVGEATDLPDRVPLTLHQDLESDSSTRAIGTGVQDAFSVYIKASLVLGVILSSPFIFYFLWTFVAAGLYQHEKRYVHLFLPISIGLFLAGVAVAFFVVFRFVLAFLFGFYDWLQIDPTPRIGEWLSFVLILPVMFGIAFQLPLVMLFLERIGVTSLKTYVAYWRYAVLIIFVISMILTPAEPWSLVAMAGFLTPLYFAGILLCKYLPRRADAAATE